MQKHFPPGICSKVLSEIALKLMKESLKEFQNKSQKQRLPNFSSGDPLAVGITFHVPPARMIAPDNSVTHLTVALEAWMFGKLVEWCFPTMPHTNILTA